MIPPKRPRVGAKPPPPPPPPLRRPPATQGQMRSEHGGFVVQPPGSGSGHSMRQSYYENPASNGIARVNTSDYSFSPQQPQSNPRDAALALAAKFAAQAQNNNHNNSSSSAQK